MIYSCIKLNFINIFFIIFIKNKTEIIYDIFMIEENIKFKYNLIVVYIIYFVDKIKDDNWFKWI
jgi:hypothetical protein